MTKKCIYCTTSKNDIEFSKNIIDLVDICNCCVENSNIFSEFFEDDNSFNNYWNNHINDINFKNNVCNIILNCIEYIFKKIKVSDVINYLILLTEDTSMLELANKLSLNLVYHSIEIVCIQFRLPSHLVQ